MKIIKKTLNLSLMAFVAMITVGCGGIDPTPKKLDLKPTLQKMHNNHDILIKIKAGDSISKVIEKIQKRFPKRVFIDKTESKIIFTRDLPEMGPEELSKYIKLNFGKIIIMRKYSDQIFAVEEINTKQKTSSIKNGSYKIPNIELKINGEFTYEQLLNLLRERGVNIYVDTEQPFDYSKKAGEFIGSVKEYLEYMSAKEKLFVITTDSGIKLKDTETVTYNLKIPKVKLSPVLSPTGTNTAVTVTGALNGDAETPTGGSGDIAPIDNLKKQFNTMLNKKGIFSVNESQGTISVTGNYEAIKISDKLVEDFNKIYGKGIKIELHVYEVSLDDSKAFGIDYSFLKNKLVNGGITPVASFSTNLSAPLSISGSTNPGASMSLSKFGSTTLTDANGNVASEKAASLIFNYLNKFGRTSVITKPTLETINNLPVKLDVLNSIDYVYTLEQSATNGAVSGVDTPVAISTTYKPEIKTVTTGFSLVLHPKVQGDFINIAIKNISSTLNGLEAYTYGVDNENIIRLKDVSAREFDETVKLKEGEIAIIGGYMYEKRDSLKNGLPYTTSDDHSLDALTSAKESNKHKVEIVITITAKVI